MNLFKKTLKSIMVTTAVVAIGSSMVFSVSAAPKGNVTYWHGVVTSNKQTYGKMESTETESSMRIDGKVKFLSGNNNGKTVDYQQNSTGATKVESNYISPGSVKGTSYFYYYVNNVKEHESTDWWDFDFR